MLDLSHMPDDTGPEAAAFLREVWHTFPKYPPVLTEPEEDPDDH